MLLENYPVSNPIVTDFRKHLQEIEDDFNGFNDWKRDDRANWSWGAWEGFYRRLEGELDTSNGRWIGWGRVNNPAGGFLGFGWWSSDSGELYIQIEGGPGKEAKLCFKVDAGEDNEQQENLKWRWHERVLAAGEQQVVKPDVMKRGKTMTVAWWKDDWLAFGKDGKLDISGTVENLKRSEAVLKTAISSS